MSSPLSAPLPRGTNTKAATLAEYEDLLRRNYTTLLASKRVPVTLRESSTPEECPFEMVKRYSIPNEDFRSQIENMTRAEAAQTALDLVGMVEGMILVLHSAFSSLSEKSPLQPVEAPQGIISFFPTSGENSPLVKSSETKSESGNAFNAQSLLSISGSLLQKSKVEVSHELRLGEDEFLGYETVNDYIMVGEIGAGAQGEVFLVVDQVTNEKRAMKVLKKQHELLCTPTIGSDTTFNLTASTQFASVVETTEGGKQTNLQREVAIMKKLQHRNLVLLHEVIDDPEQKKLYLFMEFVAGGCIAKNFNKDKLTCDPIPLPKLVPYVKDMVRGLGYLHRNGVLHRDIKPENILIHQETDTAKLADFGVSEFATIMINQASGGSELFTKKIRVGTPVYMAPCQWQENVEVLNGTCLDVWSLGITIYMLLFGRHPFPEILSCKTMASLPKVIEKTDIQWSFDDEEKTPVPSAWKQLLTGMLQIDPAKRSSLAVVRRSKVLRTSENLAASGEDPETPFSPDSACGGEHSAYSIDKEESISPSAEIQDLLVEEGKEKNVEFDSSPLPNVKLPPQRQSSFSAVRSKIPTTNITVVVDEAEVKKAVTRRRKSTITKPTPETARMLFGVELTRKRSGLKLKQQQPLLDDNSVLVSLAVPPPRPPLMGQNRQHSPSQHHPPIVFDTVTSSNRAVQDFMDSSHSTASNSSGAKDFEKKS